MALLLIFFFMAAIITNYNHYLFIYSIINYMNIFILYKKHGINKKKKNKNK